MLLMSYGNDGWIALIDGLFISYFFSGRPT